VTTQHDSEIIELVKDVVAFPTISTWYAGLTDDKFRRIRGVKFSVG
jgi:hypothetical protein